MLGFLILYCKGMRPMMFQLSGFYCMGLRLQGLEEGGSFSGVGGEGGGGRVLVCVFMGYA